MHIHRARQVGDDWDEVRAELARAFAVARTAAQAEENFVFVVHHDDLLGRRGVGNAMVATGLLSAARTAAIEGSRKGWTANVVAFDDLADDELVRDWAERLVADSHGVTGELIRVGSSHLGKALP
ncbi:MAG TPA: hypothetical protein VMM14_08925 [Acidimicrobiia bacterium]|nr:hypothetical protein [Acidimicrobiia bacterium]